MAVVAAVVAVVGLAVGIGGTVAAQNSARKSRSIQKKGLAEQQKARELEAKRNEATERRRRRQEIRKQRIQRAQIVNQGNQTGAGETSSIQGGLTSLNSQLNSSLGFSGQRSQFNNQISSRLQSAANFDFQAQEQNDKTGLFQNVAGVGFNAFSSAGGFGAIQKGFF